MTIVIIMIMIIMIMIIMMMIIIQMIILIIVSTPLVPVPVPHRNRGMPAYAFRESIEVRESTRVVLGTSKQKGGFGGTQG